jgi:hypothetical protein
MEETNWHRLDFDFFVKGTKEVKILLEGVDKDGKGVRGEGMAVIPDGEDWINVARALRDQYNCDAYVQMPKPDLIKICFKKDKEGDDAIRGDRKHRAKG